MSTFACNIWAYHSVVAYYTPIAALREHLRVLFDRNSSAVFVETCLAAAGFAVAAVPPCMELRAAEQSAVHNVCSFFKLQSTRTDDVFTGNVLRYTSEKMSPATQQST